MVHDKRGDIFDCEADALVNTVNCVGVMGRGIALQFKKAFPDNFKAYEAACKREEVKPGRMFVHEVGKLMQPRYIINFPTKRHWKGKSRIEDIDAGLLDLVHVIRRLGIKSIAVPPLASGLGGLNWADVRPRIVSALAPLEDVTVYLYEPDGAPSSDRMVHTHEVPEMTAARATVVELMNRYLAGLLDPFVTLLEVHKLMYFMQAIGEPLKLQFVKGLYGPYAENLRHLLNTIEGHFVSGYADAGDTPGKQLQLIPGAVEEAAKFLDEHPATRARFDRVSKLIEGFESPFGMELLGTVHWIVNSEPVLSMPDVVQSTYAWNDRKKQFTERQIRVAVSTLADHAMIGDKDYLMIN